MNPENAIEVRNITKSFRIYLDKGNTMKEKVLFKNRRKYEMREVLKGISFDVKKGEAIGLIGHNGCGKSTTLKLLTRIMYPDSGTIEMSGRVSSLIELGAGFHPDMSGRDNIYINAAIFGLTKKEIDARLEDIIEFSELQEFIDNPVRTYSSGMYMRLAFSVAINVDADILLIDEILAVGDAAFQAKCFNKLREIKARGTTIVIVSHSLGQIEQICEKSYWIHDGVIREEGAPRIVDPKYMKFMSERVNGVPQQPKENEAGTENADPPKSNSSETTGSNQPQMTQEDNSADGSTDTAQDKTTTAKDESDGKRWGSGEAKMEHIKVVDMDGRERYVFTPREPFKIEIDYKCLREIDDAVIGIAIYRKDSVHIYGTNTIIDTAEPIKLKKEGTIRLNISSMPLVTETYTIDLAIHRPDGFSYDWWQEACTLQINDPTSEIGVISLEHTWDVE